MSGAALRALAALAFTWLSLAVSGCSALHSAAGGAVVNVLEEGFTPETLSGDDADMGCAFGTAMLPLVGGIRHFSGDPSLLEAVLLQTSGICAESRSAEEELRYIRASRERRSDEALDARIAQKRLRLMAGRRELRSFERMRSRLEATYGFHYGHDCPVFLRDFDELSYLLGSIAGVQSIQSSMATERAMDAPLDLAPEVDSAMKCLGNEKWWGAPEALQGVIRTILPGPDQSAALRERFDRSMTIAERSGVRIAHVMAAIAAQSNDDTTALQSVIRRSASREHFQPNPYFRLIDHIAELQLTNHSDRLWTINTGTRTPMNKLGQFWDDRASDAIDADSFLK